MFSSYRDSDVILLLKDISGLVEPLDTNERETRIQSGIHYSEMLPIEYEPSHKYLDTYKNALRLYAKITAEAVKTVSECIWLDKGKNAVLVSLARAGTPIGILIKHYIDKKYHVSITHYTISIIRGNGIADCPKTTKGNENRAKIWYNKTIKEIDWVCKKWGTFREQIAIR